jgi:hypothetical protein
MQTIPFHRARMPQCVAGTCVVRDASSLLGAFLTVANQSQRWPRLARSPFLAQLLQHPLMCGLVVTRNDTSLHIHTSPLAPEQLVHYIATYLFSANECAYFWWQAGELRSLSVEQFCNQLVLWFLRALPPEQQRLRGQAEQLQAYLRQRFPARMVESQEWASPF